MKRADMCAPLSESLLRFIGLTIPTYHAAEVLLFLAEYPDQQWQPEDIVHRMIPVAVTLPAVKEYLTLFRIRQIVNETDGQFRFDPSTDELKKQIQALAAAYKERPVTLIQTIYHLADARKQSLDSFESQKE